MLLIINKHKLYRSIYHKSVKKHCMIRNSYLKCTKSEEVFVNFTFIASEFDIGFEAFSHEVGNRVIKMRCVFVLPLKARVVIK